MATKNWIGIYGIIFLALITGILTIYGYGILFIGVFIYLLFVIAVKRLEIMFLFWLLLSPMFMPDSMAFLTIESHPILTFDRIIILVIFIILLVQTLLRTRKLLPINNFEIPMILLFLILISSIILKSANTYRGLRVLTDAFLYPFLIYLIAKNLITSDKYFHNFINVFLFISIFLSSVGICEYFTTIDLFPTKVGLPIRSGWLRVNGPYIDDVAFAINLTLCFFVVLYKHVTEYSKKRGFHIIFSATTLFLMFISISITFLRAAWLQVICGLFIWTVFRRKGLIKLIIIIPLILLAILWSFDFIKTSIVYKDRFTAVHPIHSRFAIWRKTFLLFKQSPVLGIGFQNSYLKTEHYTHNTFLSYLTETGILGILTTIVIIILIFKTAYNYYTKSISELDKEFSIVFASILVCFYIPWFAFESGFSHEVNKVFFAILGVMVARSRNYQNMHISQQI